MKKAYAIGLDYGTQSGRAVLVELGTARELATAVKAYTHGVMDERLPDGTRLPPDWALQHSQDYLEVLAHTIPEVLRQAGVSAADVVGVGVDFTACTLLPIDAQGTPLCTLAQYEHEPHAYVKLWKHHAAQHEANEINRIATERGETFLERYGGKISSEWMLPKIWQVLDEAPEIYAAADRFIEAGDWLILQMTGNERRNACMAGYKATWNQRTGYPSPDFLRALDPRLENLVADKLAADIYPTGAKAGEITAAMAALTGLQVGTAVAVCNIDAHASLPAVGINGPGKMLMIMGTSTCHILVDTQERPVPGICGIVQDGVLPGFQGYEAGQSCVGDHFEWFIENGVPAAYYKQAAARGLHIHELLSEKAAALRVGQSGLLALDWWNGNRSVLVDVDLTGLILGCTLLTKPEEIYRALIEATAYGTRMIVENFRKHGVPVEQLYACGGIANKNKLLMQIYADVTNMQIRIGASSQAPAVGSAMFGAVAAGAARGGYDSILDAARQMGRVQDTVYTPHPENVALYDQLYTHYARLHDYFGRGENTVMKQLKLLRERQLT